MAKYFCASICVNSTLATVVGQTISHTLKATAAPECTPSIFCQSRAIGLCVDKLFLVTFKQSDKAVGWGFEQRHRETVERAAPLNLEALTERVSLG